MILSIAASAASISAFVLRLGGCFTSRPAAPTELGVEAVTVAVKQYDFAELLARWQLRGDFAASWLATPGGASAIGKIKKNSRLLFVKHANYKFGGRVKLATQLKRNYHAYRYSEIFQ